MSRRLPYKGRTVDVAMLPAGFRRRYILLMSFVSGLLIRHLDKQITKCALKDPLGIFTRRTNLNSGIGANSMKLDGLKGPDKEKVAELRDAMDAKRRGYEEGRANHETPPREPYSSATAPEKADPAMSNLFATQLQNERSGRYGKGRGRFVVHEEDVFSPLDEDVVPINEEKKEASQ